MSANTAYLAGFFDGEGCITIGANGNITLSVINTSRPVLDIFEQTLGGAVHNRKQIWNKPQYDWRAYGDEALSVLTELLPYLVEKKDQAFTVLEWAMVRKELQPVQKEKGRGRLAHPERAEVLKHFRKVLTEMKLGTYGFFATSTINHTQNVFTSSR